MPSPTKHRPLSRQPSSPSLAVGLPPPLPESNVMTPSTSTKSLKRSRRHRQHRGDVESSATSAGNSSDDAEFLATPVHSTLSMDVTPKRKVLGPVESTMSGARKKRETLQARLQASTQVRKSRSVGDNLRGSGMEDGSVNTSLKRGSVSSDKVVVCVSRVKPTTSSFLSLAYDLTSTSLSLSDAHPNVIKRGGKAGRENEYTYTFDALLRAPAKTPQLYHAKVAPLVDKAMNGFNSTIFAYGQTGSGKSFTMASYPSGSPTELGIIPCAVDGVFDAINTEQDRAYLLRVSYIEIYNETLRDLLNFKRGPLRDDEKPFIHTSKGKVYVEPLVEHIVSTPQDVIDLLNKGNAGRKTSATDWNERSSRSHSVFSIVIESRPRDGNGDDDIRLSRLSLIDLAGSEKAVSDLERRGEGRHINRSLLALKNVINKLTDKKSGHIPYRDSKLTHLLENALGGDSNICVICTLSAEEEHASETLETLKFAGTCSQVETQAKKNVLLSSDRALIKAKDKEIEVLKRRLQVLADDRPTTPHPGQIADLADSVAAMEARKATLNMQLARLNAEILTSEFPRGAQPAPSMIKRRRISDFTPTPGSSRMALGVGSPRPEKDSRRTVSTMLRVPEENGLEMLSGFVHPPFEHDRQVATLKRNLAAREAELTSAIEQARQMSIAKVEADRTLQDRANLLEETEDCMRDMHGQLESTRAELVSVINEKAAKIDELENTVLDLRKSREDLIIEDQQRLEDVQAEVDRLRMMRMNDDSLRKALEEKDRVVEELDALKTEHAREFTRFKADYEAIKTPQTDRETRYYQAMSEVERLRVEHPPVVEELRAENAALARARDQATEALDGFQKAVIGMESEAMVTLKTALEQERETKVGLQQDVEKMSSQIDVEISLNRQLSEELSNTRMASAAIRDAVAKHHQEAKEALKGKTILEAELDTVRRKVDQLSAQLKIERSVVSEHIRARSDLETQVASLFEKARLQQRQADVTMVSHEEELQRLVGQSRSEHDDLKFQLDNARDEIVRVKKSHQTEQDIAHGRDIELQQTIVSKDAEMVQLTVQLTQARNDLASQDEIQCSLDAARGEIRQLREIIDGLERSLGEAAAAMTNLEKDNLEQDDQIRRLKEQAEMEKKGALESAAGAKELQAEQEKVRSLQGEVEIERRTRGVFEGDLRKMTDKSNEMSSLVTRLQTEATVTSEELREMSASNDRQANRALEAETKITRLEAALSAAQGDLQSLESEYEKTKESLATSREDALQSKDKAIKLAKELLELKNTASKKTSPEKFWSGHESWAGHGLSGSSSVRSNLRLQALQSDGNQTDKEEIERLEKVVEVQQIIIEDQREKIVFWSTELEKQREVVRLLTQDGNINRISPRTKSPRLSLSRAPNVGESSPSLTPSAVGSKKTRTHLPSSFTARNLALPTSPTPLPMHGKQVSSASKKGRRLTIEADMDFLTESSKVNRQRELFDIPSASPSPEKNPRTFVLAAPPSVPRQRRP
ncbi:hypothetical protein M231_03394 [Tremella mesenterica]|uniref:Kinesin motor domain-containing protein n=1 Tax=Tremella mesenterica TaxID=5217 RepID=A0A4Q1BN78_TREME|nr:hypothetical protein M231_03394 [Tremella mesenterica]